METTNRYSDKELEKFKKLIEEKIIKANTDLNLLKIAAAQKQDFIGFVFEK